DPLGGMVAKVRRAVFLRDAETMTDDELLEWFLTHREDAAFEALMRRHGPMVLGVCRRVLHQQQDAEDAFQPTFLVLIHKARSITKRQFLGTWLYSVAYRTALRARTMHDRQRAREREVMARFRPETPEENRWHELAPLLDKEIGRLPEAYRGPLL